MQLDYKPLPHVTTAFRKCMKGRFGCGGSSHPRLRVTCASASNCGPCGGGAGGCNILGSTLWYCPSPTIKRCQCIDTMFHEASHSCGILHSAEYLQLRTCQVPNERACEIGEWFGDRFEGPDSSCMGAQQLVRPGLPAKSGGSHAN